MKGFLLPVFQLTLVATFVAGGAVALAQDAPPPPSGPAKRSLIATRCKDDMPKFCADVPPGGGRLAVCLRKHDAELSEPCKTALSAAGPASKSVMAAPAAAAGAPAAVPAPGKHAGPPHGMEWGPMHGMHKACAADADKFCKEVPPGHGRVVVCLNEHTNELAAGCKALVGKVMEHMNEPMQPHADCAADVQKLCGDVPPGFGRVGFCLGEHTAELSPACKKQIDEMKTHWNKRARKGDVKGATKAVATGAPAMAPAPATPAPAAPAMAAPTHAPDAPIPGK